MKTPLTLIIALLPVAIASCVGGNRPTSTYEDLPDSDYRRVITSAILNDDPERFASMCRYPIEREYPLRDIDDSAMMVKYFHTLIDDSIKLIISASSPEQWPEFGWRGSSLIDGSYIWCDEGAIYSIPYQSVRERTMLDSLKRAYFASLPYQQTSGWLPETCYTDSTGTAYLIDRTEDGEQYRLTMVRLSNGAIDPSTCESLPGILEIQGSAATHVYSFTGKDSTIWEIIYLPYEDITFLSREKSGKSEQSGQLTKANWLDMIKNNPS